MIRWVVAALICYLAVILYQLPAQFVLSWIETPKELYLSGVEGSIWQGKADTVTWQGEGVDELSWTLSGSALLRGRIELDMIAGSRRSPIKLTGQAGYSSQGWYAQNLDFQIPAATIGQLFKLPAKLEGTLKGQITEASQGEPWCQNLSGELNWLSPVVNSKLIGDPLLLDNTKAVLSCDNEGQMVAQLSDGGQVLGLTATATLEATQYRVEGELAPGGEFPEKLKQGLSFIAAPIGAGRYRVKLDGPLQ